MQRAGVGGVVVGALLVSFETFAAPPSASGSSMRLEYHRALGAEACPDADAWRDMVVAKIEGAADPFEATGANVLLVTMERRPNGFRATFDVRDAAGLSQGTQEQIAATCPEAARALATSASLLFLARPTASSTPVAVLPVPSPRAPRPLPSPTAAATGRRFRVQLGASAGAAAGFSPFVTPSFGALVGLRFPLGDAGTATALAISVEGRGDLPSSSQSFSGPQGQSARVHGTFIGGTLAPCAHGAGWLMGCLLVTVGEVRAELGPDTTPAAQAALFVGVGARAGVEVPLLRGRPGLALRLAVDGWFSIARPEARIAGAPVWTAPPAAGNIGAAVVALF